MKKIIEFDVFLKNTILGDNNWIIFIGFNSKIYNTEIGNNVQISSKVVKR